MVTLLMFSLMIFDLGLIMYFVVLISVSFSTIIYLFGHVLDHL